MLYNHADFEKARLAYPGVKRGAETEYENYVKKLKKWRLKESEVTPLLLPAIEFQIKAREGKNWNPGWKHFSTWINNRWWEAVSDTGKKAPTKCHFCGGEWSGTFFYKPINKEVRSCYPCKIQNRKY